MKCMRTTTVNWSLYIVGVVFMGLMLSLTQTTAATEQSTIEPAVKPGIEVFLEEHLDWIKDKRVGLVTNPTGINSDMKSDINLLHNHGDVNLTALFGPEHGIRGDRGAGEYIESYIDEQTGLPVYSLYGPTWHPSEDMLEDVDVLLYDMQDIGSNVYTYIYTLGFIMESAAEYGKEVIVLDRPNAIGGDRVEGPLRDADTVTYMGRYLLPVRHGMTAGELATMWNHEHGLGISLKVAQMDGWERTMQHEDTGLPWVFPSPNIPTPTSADLYTGTELVKESNASVGLGTTKPFELLGAPWLDGVALAEDLNSRDIPGVQFRSAAFTPQFDRFQGELVTGIQVHVTDAQAIDLVELTLNIMDAMRDQAPDDFVLGPTNRFGDKSVQELFNDDVSIPDIMASWEDELAEWVHHLRNNYLMYGPYPDHAEPYESQPVLGILPLDLDVAPGEETQLTVHGVDADGQSLDIDDSAVTWDVSDGIGDVVDGAFVAGESGVGSITTTYDGIKVERKVNIAENIVEDIRYGVHPSYTRMVIDLNRDTDYEIENEGETVKVSIPYAQSGNDLDSEGTIIISNSPVVSAAHYEVTNDAFLITFDLKAEATIETPSFSDRIVIDFMLD